MDLLKFFQLLRDPGRIRRRAKKVFRQWRARRYRAKLDSAGIEWIAVTGSCGKSTTARLLAGVLSRHGACPEPEPESNYTGTVPLSILRVKTTDRYVVQEIGTHMPGSIKKLAGMVRPRIGIIMNVGTDHYTQFGGQDAIAEEKAALARSLPADGVAILNADDPRVAAMASDTAARVVTFGIEQDADFRAREVSAAWPEPAAFVLEHEGRTYPVRTRMFGAHLVPNVLATLAAAHHAGVSMEDAIEGVAQVEPIDGRMSEVKTSGGATFIRDDLKAPWWALELAVDFLRDANAKKKVLVLGEMSDNPGNKGRKFRRLINGTLDHVDLIVVAGPAIAKLNKSLREHSKVKVCQTVREASGFLDTILGPGDLVVLKGRLQDHLERLAHCRVGIVGCWRSRCGRIIQCSNCDLLETPAEPEDAVPH